MLTFPKEVEIVQPVGGANEQFYIRCSLHNYFGQGAGPMISGCKSCWVTYYFVRIAKGEFKDGEDEMLEMLLNHVAEDIAEGNFDLKLYKRPKVEIAKEIKIVEG